MKRKKNILSKAAVLLITSLMVFSTITSVIANTGTEPEVVTLPNTDPPEDIRYLSSGNEQTERRPHKVVIGPRERADNDFDEGYSMGPFTFDQSTIPPDWAFAPINTGYGNPGYDNFFGIPPNSVIQTVSIIGLSLKFIPSSETWVVCDTEAAKFSIKFYSQPSSCHAIPPANQVEHFSFGTGEYVCTELPASYSGFTLYKWTFDLPTDVALSDGWMRVTQTADNGGCLWGNSLDGDSFSYWGKVHHHDLAFILKGYSNFVCEPGVCDLIIDDVNNIENGGVICSIPKNINITVGNYGDIGMTDAKILIDIYERVCGETNITFDDDIESYNPLTQDDNVNWTPIDNGDGDTWTIWCEESHSPTQSYRCTQGKYRGPCDPSDDTYLGHSSVNDGADILRMDNPLDLDGAACATVSFWHKCTGEYYTSSLGNVRPIDYGALEYSLDAGVSWHRVPEFVAYDNPWQQITVKIVDTSMQELTCPACNTDDADYVIETGDLSGKQLLLQFVWTADPSLQFEGWYIDDVQIQRTDTLDMTAPVWQGWQIVAIPPCTPEQNLVFPVGFSGEVGNCYQMDIIGQVFDCNDFDLSNNEFSIQFCVDDLHDMATTDIIGPAILNNDEDTTYNVTVKNVGSFAENNVPVSLKISKSELIAGSSLDDDFESSPTGWMAGYFVGAQPKSLWHWSTQDAFSGTHCMACYNDANMLEPNLGCLLIPDMTIDLRDNDITECTLSYNIKWSIPDNGPFGSYFAIGLGHPDESWLIQTTYPPFWGSYENEWCGPDNPGEWVPEMFQWDMIDTLEEFKASYPDAFPDDRIELYFIVTTDETSTNILNADNPEYWSGVMLDDIEIRTIRPSSTNVMTVDTKTTGILNPGESQTLTMSWNNSQYCNWVVSGETQLAGDVNASNDKSHTQTLVSDTVTDHSYDSIDITGYPGDSLWHIVTKEGSEPDGPATDSYWWCGKVYSTWGGYTNNMDDSLISEPMNLTSSASLNGATFQFGTWHKFADNSDYGEVYYSTDDGATWEYVDRFTKDMICYDWYTTAEYRIPASDCTDQVRLKFRMVSNDKYVSSGWYVDDIVVSDYTTYQRTILSEGFEINSCTVDPDHKYNWAIESTKFAGGSRPEMVLDDSPLFTGTTWIELGPFDTTGYTTLSLSALTKMRKDANQAVRVQVRTNGGGTWNIEPVYNETVPGNVYQQMDVAVTLDASNGVGSSDFCIRFYFIGRNNNIRGWNIDNVKLQDNVAPFDVIAYETFTTKWIDDRDWTLIHQGGSSCCPCWVAGTTSPYEGEHQAEILTCDCTEQNEHMQSPVLLYTLAPDELLVMKFQNYRRSFNTICPEQDLIEVYDGTSWNVITDLTLSPLPGLRWHEMRFELPSDTQQVNFHRISSLPSGSETWRVDNVEIEVHTTLGCYYTFDFEQNYYLSHDWKTESSHAGDFWQQDIACPFGDYDGDGIANACIDYPNTGTGLNDALYTVIDLTEDSGITYARCQFAISYRVAAWDDCRVYVELSTNYDPSENMGESSANWKVLVTNGYWNATGGWLPYDCDISDYIGKTVTMRFRLTTPGNELFTPYTQNDAGYWVDGFTLLYKEKPPATDVLPPTTAIVFSGNTCTLLAADQAGPVVSGVATTYYTLNGGAQQTYTTPFTLADGSNTVEYWSVDNAGNEETHKTGTCIVDVSPPTITIIAPEDGFYLFGNKLFSLEDRIFCIGKIIIEAEVSDISGISMVTFSADGDTGYDADGSDGYTYLFNQRHFGQLDVTATAYDENGLSAEDTISLKIFCFGI